MSLSHKLYDPERSMPLVMGILNVTPDSFSDGGQFTTKQQVLTQVQYMVDSGVDIIDIGGESTRPGAAEVSLQLEIDRVMPAIEWVREITDVPISIDTYKTDLMRLAINQKVQMINDVNALCSEGAVELLANSNVMACLMHRKGNASFMQDNPVYDNVVEDVVAFLENRLDICLEAGCSSENLMIDPGFGFGKTLEHNVRLFECLDEFVSMGPPVLVGVSRKSMIGLLQSEKTSDDRLAGSLGAAVLAMLKGVSVLRVHDVKETVQALRVASALI